MVLSYKGYPIIHPIKSKTPPKNDNIILHLPITTKDSTQDFAKEPYRRKLKIVRLLYVREILLHQRLQNF